MREIWKDIEGYEGRYQVSNLGRVKSLKDNHGNQREKILSLRYHKNGYVYVMLSKEYKMKTFRVHRLVANVFIDNVNNYEIVNHKDENKSNNCVENLEWCNQKYNANYGNRNKKLSIKLKKYKRTKEHQENINKQMKKTHCKKVICITTGEKFNSIKEASDKMETCETTIIMCCKGKRKSAGKHIITKEKLVWKYDDEMC